MFNALFLNLNSVFFISSTLTPISCLRCHLILNLGCLYSIANEPSPKHQPLLGRQEAPSLPGTLRLPVGFPEVPSYSTAPQPSPRGASASLRLCRFFWANSDLPGFCSSRLLLLFPSPLVV